jgi:hypothetical protein
MAFSYGTSQLLYSSSRAILKGGIGDSRGSLILLSFKQKSFYKSRLKVLRDEEFRHTFAPGI